MAQILTSPDLKINNISVAYAGNTVTLMEGLGERTFTVQASGGAVEAVWGDDVTTKIGGVKFSLSNTDTNVELAKVWHGNGEENVITVSKGSYTRSFAKAVLVTDPEYTFSNDGAVEIEFKSQPAV